MAEKEKKETKKKTVKKTTIEHVEQVGPGKIELSLSNGKSAVVGGNIK